MNDRQRAKHDSNLALRTVCNKDANRALWSSLPAFVQLYDRFLAKISYLNACVLTQSSDTSGITAAKNESRAKLTDSILEAAGALCTLGLLRADLDLQAKSDLQASDIQRLPDTEVDDRGTLLLGLARALPAPAPNQPSLTDVGLTPGKLDLLETRIETYNLLLGSPRAARGEKTAATGNLQRTLDEIDDILGKGLDKLILQFRGTDFHSQYQSARTPIAPPTRKPDPAAPPAPAPSNPTPTPPTT